MKSKTKQHEQRKRCSKTSISMPRATLVAALRRADEQNRSFSNYISNLVAADVENDVENTPINHEHADVIMEQPKEI